MTDTKITHKSIDADGKVVWTEPITIPDGDYVYCVCVNLPYKTGQVITVICNACGGSGKQTFDLVYDIMIDTVFHRCPICKGKPELKVKVTAISVADGEFRMEGDLL
jgi:hypothetical protein